jgi:hypothetical protein
MDTECYVHGSAVTIKQPGQDTECCVHGSVVTMKQPGQDTECHVHGSVVTMNSLDRTQSAVCMGALSL